MYDIIADNMDEIYRQICTELVFIGDEVRGTKELNNYSFKLTNLNNNVVNVRRISKSYLCAELLWYFLGRNDVKFISPFASMWEKITDDGITNNSAYGDIIFKRHGFDQIDKIIELLTVDPTSRRAVINFNVPNKNVIETKDEICTIALHFLIRDDKLNCTAIMRSNDIWFGLPYDVVFFTELTKYIAHRLNIEPGIYSHDVMSLHCYEKDYDAIQKAIYAEPEEKISIDIEKLVMFKKVVERAVIDAENKREIIIDICEKLGIIKVIDVEAEMLAYTD